MLMTLLACWRLDQTVRWLMILSLACVSCAALLHFRIWRLPG
jgi:tryptophan-rich sensory protein